MIGVGIHTTTFFMKIDYYITKIVAKLRHIILKTCGNTNKAHILIKIVLASMITSNYYYYAKDVFAYGPVIFILMTILLYILISLAYLLGKIGIKILKHIKYKNIISFCFLNYLFFKLFEEIGDEAYLDDKEFILSIVSTIVVFIFLKSLVAVFVNKEKVPIIFFIPTLIIVVGSISFLIYNKPIEKDKFSMGTRDVDLKANYSSKSLEYTGGDVNLLKYVNYSGKKKKIRDYYFKKSLYEVPVKGKIWYPENKKNSPILILAHGNHRMTEENYLGYDYLGRALARCGYIVASVDMNMLNGFMKYGLGNENDARAVLLLENVKYLLEESKDPKSPIFNLIDENNIVIGGHSRGGEAAYIAASMNSLKYNADNGEELDYNFKIKGIISISQTFDQYKMAGKSILNKDINLLAIHGSHDKDVKGFEGMDSFDNLTFSKGSKNFKSAIYIGYANHGQFNSMWSSSDTDPPYNLFTDKRSLLRREDQEKILTKLSKEFLDVSFGFSNKKDIFKSIEDYDLPETLYYERYADSDFDIVCDYEDDYRLETFKYGKIKFENLGQIKERKSNIGSYKTQNTEVNLKAHNGSRYEIVFDDDHLAKDNFVFDVMLKEKYYDPKSKDINIILRDSFGNEIKRSVSDFKQLNSEIKVQLSKLQDFTKEYDYKNSFQTVIIPISNEEFKYDELKSIEFLFDGNIDISIDNIGFCN